MWVVGLSRLHKADVGALFKQNVCLGLAITVKMPIFSEWCHARGVLLPGFNVFPEGFAVVIGGAFLNDSIYILTPCSTKFFLTVLLVLFGGEPVIIDSSLLEQPLFLLYHFLEW